MKAIVSVKYGAVDGLQLQEIETPIPADNEVRVKVHASTVTQGDVMLRKLTFPLSILFWKPVQKVLGFPPRKKTPGHEFAGEVDMVGKSVTGFEKGDQVFGTTTGLTVGANAEYVCVPETSTTGVLAKMPENMSYEDAAAVPVGAMTALFILREANVQAAKKVLIYGASGSVGTFAVQIAKAFGAEVTAVCGTRNLELVKSLGANHVIDYTKEDFTTNDETYDIVFDAVGKNSASRSKRVLNENGRFVSIRSSTTENLENFLYLKDLIEAGSLRSVIDRSYPLEQTADAHRYVEAGHKTGNVVITVEHSDTKR